MILGVMVEYQAVGIKARCGMRQQRKTQALWRRGRFLMGCSSLLPVGAGGGTFDDAVGNDLTKHPNTKHLAASGNAVGTQLTSRNVWPAEL
jgi:hypothetical protein